MKNFYRLFMDKSIALAQLFNIDTDFSFSELSIVKRYTTIGEIRYWNRLECIVQPFLFFLVIDFDIWHLLVKKFSWSFNFRSFVKKSKIEQSQNVFWYKPQCPIKVSYKKTNWPMMAPPKLGLSAPTCVHQATEVIGSSAFWTGFRLKGYFCFFFKDNNAHNIRDKDERTLSKFNHKTSYTIIGCSKKCLSNDSEKQCLFVGLSCAVFRSRCRILTAFWKLQ